MAFSQCRLREPKNQAKYLLLLRESIDLSPAVGFFALKGLHSSLLLLSCKQDFADTFPAIFRLISFGCECGALFGLVGLFERQGLVVRLHLLGRYGAA